MSTLAARQPSFSTAPTHLQSRSATVAVSDIDVEPSEEWKQDLRQRIEEGLQDMVNDAKTSLESKRKQAPTSTLYQEQLLQEYSAAMSSIRRLAAEQFQVELERERQERRWAAGIALTPGWDEALKQEQQSILDTIQKAGKPDDLLAELSPRSPHPPYTGTHASDISRPLPSDSVSRRDAYAPYSGTPSIPDSVSRRDPYSAAQARNTDALRSPLVPDPTTRRDGHSNGSVRSPDYGALSRDRDAVSIRSNDSGYGTGTTVVDEPEEIPPRPKRRSDVSSHLDRQAEDVERQPEPSGRPIDRPLARSLSERHANSPPRPPELWKPSISPEEDIASSRPYQMPRRGSTASMKSNNSGSASYRSPSTNPIPERIKEQMEGESLGERERDRDRDREKSRSQEVSSPWTYDRPRERQDSTTFRPDNRQGSINTPQRRPQTVEELELQSMQHTAAYTSWFTDPNARVPPPPSARVDPTDYSPRVTDQRYQTHRSASRPYIPDEFDFRLPPDLPESRSYRTPSLPLDHPPYFGDHETDARIMTAATGRRPSLSRRSDSQQGGLSSKPSREHSLTMDLARQQQPLSSPVINGPKYSPIADDLRYASPTNGRDLLDDSSSLRRSSVSEGQNGTRSSASYGSSRLPSTSPNTYSYPAASPTPPMPMPGRSGKYDYQRSSPGSKEWNDSPRSAEGRGDTGSFTQYGAAMEGRRPLSSRPSLQTFRPDLPAVSAEDEIGDDMDPEPVPELSYQPPSRHRTSDADLRPYRQPSAGVERYRENKRLEEQVRREEEEKRQQLEAAKAEEDRRKSQEEARRREEARERARRREEAVRAEAKRKEEEAARAEAKRKEEEAAEARRMEEEEERARLEELQKQEEARQEEIRREQARQERMRKEDEARREAVARRKREEEARKEAARLKRELESRELERLRKEEEAKKVAARQEELRKQEEARMIAEAEAAREEERRRRLADEAEARRRLQEAAEEARRAEIKRKEDELAAEEARRAEIKRRDEELAAREEEARRKRLSEEADARRKQEAAEEVKRAEIKRKEGELAARRAEVQRRVEEEARLRLEEETKRKEEEVKRKEEEAKKKEEEVRKKEEEARRKEEEIKLKEEEARRKAEEMQRKEEETRRKEEEIRRREEDLRRREAELKRREDEARRKEEEKQKAEQEKERLRREEERQRAQQQEEFRKREEDIKRRAEERKRHDSESSGSYPGTSPTSSSWTSSHRSTTSHIPSSSPTDRTSTPSRSNTAAWSTWGSTATNSPYANGTRPTPGTSSTPKPTASAPRTASASTPSVSPSTPISEAEWARRQADQAKRQQEAFRKEQERLEMERQAKQGRILTKEEVHKLFQTHEIQWSKLATLEELNWDSFPWPMIKKPASAEDITTAAVSGYVLSPHYPDKTKSDKDRIKEYIRRWHPDRFETKYLIRVTQGDKERVKEGAGTVVRNLNDLLTRTNAPSLFS